MSTTVAGVDSGQGWSPLMRMQGQLQKAVNNGTVQAGDQDALSSALTDISTQLQANAAGSTGTPAPGSMKSQIDSIISGDVSSGKLTSDQADELKSVFAQAAQKMHGHGHHHGGGMKAASSDSDDPDSDSSTTDPITGAAQTATSSFASFIQQLETALTNSINGVTGSSATTDATASTSAATGTSASSSSTSTQSSSDPRQLMLSFLQKLESSLGGGNTYGATGTSGSTNAQAVLVNALA